MTENCFVVELDGTICQGYGVKATQEKLAKLLKIHIDQAVQILGGKPFPVKKKIDLATAERYKAAIEKTGANCRIRNISITSNDIHEQDIEWVREEAQRLLIMELAILGKMLEEPGVITTSQAGQSQTFDRASMPKEIEILKGEQTKLGSFKTVLAVIGTMKAGKSTTINAIIGTEVLPNRDRPMTALPTLIEHTPGQREPLLEFNNKQPIEKLMDDLRQVIALSKDPEIVKKLATDPDMKELLGLIEKQGKFKQRYQGAEPIFGFLKSLNDLVRLCTTLKVDFPFSDYNKIHELPVIKIEFVHLRDAPLGKGILALLDTPGPNEAEQPHLLAMMQDQLAKASAVLAVFDFSQLKSNADFQVREELKKIAETHEGRLYALVNKFDQKNRNSDPIEKVKADVVSLMGRCIDEESVFPVSSKRAYLANRAKHELFMHKKLPDPKEQAWVADFGEEAFGARWERQITNLDVVREGVQSLWEDSLFHAPLEKIIFPAHARSAVLAVDSASEKLFDVVERLENFLTTRETALKISTQELNSKIDGLKNNIKGIDDLETKAKDKSDKNLVGLEKATKVIFKNVTAKVLAASSKYFNEGKACEKADYDKQLDKLREAEKNRGSGLSGFFRSLLQEGFPRSNPQSDAYIANDFDPKNPIMSFSNKKEAQSLLFKIDKELTVIVKHGESTMKIAMDATLSEFQSDFAKDITTEAEKIINEIQGQMGKSGFSISLNVPDTSLLSLNMTGADMLSDLLSEKTKTVVESRRKTGVWGTVCGWVSSSDWGWESYNVEEKYIEINIIKIKNTMDANVEKIFSGLDKAVFEKIRAPLQGRIKDFFENFKQDIEQIRGDLLQGIEDKKRSQADQENLLQQFSALRKKLPAIRTDCAGLRKDVKKRLSGSMERIA